ATIARMLVEPRNTHKFHQAHGSSRVGRMGYGGPSSSQGTQFHSNTGEQLLVDKHFVHVEHNNLQNDL
ncbi:N-acetyltransferase, partial [Sesbania bispinosa]